MSDAAPMSEELSKEPEGPSRTHESGLLADPVVRIGVYGVTGLVILFLATVVGVMATGITAPTGPRSVAEREVMIAAARTAGATGTATTPYINALIAAGNPQAARIVLNQARASVGATEPVSDLDLAEARLFSMDGKYDKALTFADKAMMGYEDERDALIAARAKTETATATANEPVILRPNYYNAVLVKARALVELGRFSDAVAAYDIYIANDPAAADILVDRGNAKAAMKDNAGAEKDFRKALKFVPYDEGAKAGLQKMGVAE